MVRLLAKSVITNDIVGSWLLILFGLTLPLSVAINNIVAGLIILIWFYKGAFKESWQIIKNSPFLIAILLFFLLHIIGMLWTDDISWGLHIIKKEWKFLLLPIMMSLVKREHIRYYISAFLVVISISELSSYLIWFKVIPPIFSATQYDPTPFMSHISYNPFLAFAIYLIGYYLLFDKSLSKLQKLLFTLFFFTMSINMFITGGRAGQVGYLVMIALLIFQYFNKNLIKGLLFSLLILGGVFFTAYSSSTIFRDRVNLVASDISNFHQDRNTNVGMRITYALNSLEIIRDNILIGVGTGDYLSSYTLVNSKNSPEIEVRAHPHNMYLLEMVQFGLLGLVSLLSIFYFQIRFAFHVKNDMQKRIGLALPLLFMVIMLSDSYLLGHFTSMLFIFFSAFLYRSFDETD